MNAQTVAALFVHTNGHYFGLADVDPWDAHRDARKYAGPYPVVAHPPCGRWCQLAFMNQKRYGHAVGDDGGCFASALESVRRFGGVLEHPAHSHAWRAFGLPRPKRGLWLSDGRGYVTEIHQSTYGHRARKATWLYYVGAAAPPGLDWNIERPRAQCSYFTNHRNYSGLPQLGKNEAQRTPVAFRDVLLTLARGVTPMAVAA